MGVISNAIYFPGASQASSRFASISLSLSLSFSWQSDLLSLTRTTAPPFPSTLILQTLQHGAAHLCSFVKAQTDPESVLAIWRINVSPVLAILHKTAQSLDYPNSSPKPKKQQEKKNQYFFNLNSQIIRNILYYMVFC